MHDIWNRIAWVIVGLGLACCALWGASDMRILGVTDEDWKIVVLVASIIAACIGGYFLCLLGAILLKGDRDAMCFSEPGAAVAATLIATCFMFDFGAIVAPPMAITSITPA